jgi:hypothetical protein
MAEKEKKEEFSWGKSLAEGVSTIGGSIKESYQPTAMNLQRGGYDANSQLQKIRDMYSNSPAPAPIQMQPQIGSDVDERLRQLRILEAQRLMQPRAQQHLEISRG